MTHFKLLASIFLIFTITIYSREQCEWTASTAGSQAACLPGSYIKGICGSGVRALCKSTLSPLGPKHDFQINCCTDSRTNYNPGNCDANYVSDSGSTTCPTGKSIWGVCSSNAVPACEASRSALPKPYAVNCCENASNMNVDYNDCDWVYGSDGQNLECGSNNILVGMCGSGSGEDCAAGSGNSTEVAAYGAYCCKWA